MTNTCQLRKDGYLANCGSPEGCIKKITMDTGVSGGFNAAIFRRGSKVEAFGLEPDAELDDAQELMYKLQNLYETWEATRNGSNVIGAIWRPHQRVSEATVIKGKILSHMGFQQGSKLLLHMEEALYLLDRANILLFCDYGKSGKRVLSIQEAQRLLSVTGMCLDAYIVYCKYVRAGYIMQRYPCTWVLKPSEDPAQVWSSWDQQNAKDATATSLLLEKTKHVQSSSQQQQPTDSSIKTQPWWQSSTWPEALNPSVIIHCTVQESLYPNMFTLPRLQKVALPVDVSDRQRPLDFQIYAPNSMFSRRSPEPPQQRLKLCTGKETLSSLFTEISAAESKAEGVHIHYSTVEKGDVAIYGFPHVALRNILH